MFSMASDCKKGVGRLVDLMKKWPPATGMIIVIH